MNAETVKAVQDALSPLAHKLGEGAGHLYEVYVRQIATEAIVWLITLSVILLALTIFWIFAAPRVWRSAKADLARMNEERGEYRSRDKDLTDVWQGGVFIVASIVTVVVLFINLIAMPHLTTKLLNPEYYAIERLLNQVKG